MAVRKRRSMKRKVLDRMRVLLAKHKVEKAYVKSGYNKNSPEYRKAVRGLVEALIVDKQPPP